MLSGFSKGLNWTLAISLLLIGATHPATANMVGAPVKMDNIQTMVALQKVNAYCEGPFWLRDADTCKTWVEKLQDGPRPDDSNDGKITVEGVKAEYSEMGKP